MILCVCCLEKQVGNELFPSSGSCWTNPSPGYFHPTSKRKFPILLKSIKIQKRGEEDAVDWKSREILRKISVNYELFCSPWPVLDSGTESRAGGGTSLFFPLDFWWLLQEITSRHSSPCAFGAVIDANLLQSNLLFIPQKSEAAKERGRFILGVQRIFLLYFLP